MGAAFRTSACTKAGTWEKSPGMVFEAVAMTVIARRGASVFGYALDIGPSILSTC